MLRHDDMITIIVWKGALYEYVNPQNVSLGLFTFRSSCGKEYNIDLRGFLSAIKFNKRKCA